MTSRTSLFERLTPWIFVALWSTGFVVARYSTNNAGPVSFTHLTLPTTLTLALDVVATVVCT